MLPHRNHIPAAHPHVFDVRYITPRFGGMMQKMAAHRRADHEQLVVCRQERRDAELIPKVE